MKKSNDLRLSYGALKVHVGSQLYHAQQTYVVVGIWIADREADHRYGEEGKGSARSARVIISGSAGFWAVTPASGRISLEL